jgi:hypothetical protein
LAHLLYWAAQKAGKKKHVLLTDPHLAPKN